MPFYNYECTKGCKVKQLSKQQKKTLCIEKHPKGLLVWTVNHSMNEWPKVQCPVCGADARPTWHGTKQYGYVRGNCYLNRADCARQRDIALLETGNDPYARFRQPGEADYIKSQLKKAKIRSR